MTNPTNSLKQENCFCDNNEQSHQEIDKLNTRHQYFKFLEAEEIQTVKHSSWRSIQPI